MIIERFFAVMGTTKPTYNGSFGGSFDHVEPSNINKTVDSGRPTI